PAARSRRSRIRLEMILALVVALACSIPGDRLGVEHGAVAERSFAHVKLAEVFVRTYMDSKLNCHPHLRDRQRALIEANLEVDTAAALLDARPNPARWQESASE